MQSTFEKDQENNCFWNWGRGVGWGGMFLNREEERVLPLLEKPQLFATFDCPPQNTITTKCHPFPPSSSPLDWRV